MTELVEYLAATIAGERSAAEALEAMPLDDVREAARIHGVLPLVAHRLGELKASPRLLSVLNEEAHRLAPSDLLKGHELRLCLDALGRAGIPVLLMKGGQLAYSHYERPDLRPRLDSDILIQVEARSRVDRVLVDCGYTAEAQLPGELVMYQATYTKRRQSALIHALDVHWRIANPQVFGGILSFDELSAEAVQVPGLGPSARGLAPAHALLLACIHRVAHHFDSGYLLWLYDIHLVASRMDRSEWTHFVDLAQARGVTAVCSHGLRQAIQCFGTSVPPEVMATFSQARQSPVEAATAAYLTKRRHVENIVADIRALPTWSSRARLLLEHAFPPARYMRNVYAPSSHLPLPVLYAQRAVRGARKWFGRAA